MHWTRGTVRKGASAAALLGALIALALASGAGAESPTKTEGQGTEYRLGIEVDPQRLPKGEAEPVELLLTGEIGRPDGTHPSPLQELSLDLDRDISLDLTGVPACHFSRLQIQAPPGADELRKKCRRSIVGRGSAKTEIALPEGLRVPTQSGLLIFNGGVQRGIETLYARFEIDVPVPASIVTTIEIRRIRDGRLGTRLSLTPPKIAGGNGSLTSLRMRLFKRFRAEGETHSVISARCAHGALVARAGATFAEGSTRHSRATHRCALGG